MAGSLSLSLPDTVCVHYTHNLEREREGKTHGKLKLSGVCEYQAGGEREGGLTFASVALVSQSPHKIATEIAPRQSNVVV